MNNKGFFGLVGLLVAVAFICFMAYFMYKQYFGRPTGMDQSTQDAAQQAGVDTSSQSGIFGSVKSMINGVNDAEQQQAQQLDNAVAQ